MGKAQGKWVVLKENGRAVFVPEPKVTAGVYAGCGWPSERGTGEETLPEGGRRDRDQHVPGKISSIPVWHF